MSIFIIIFLIVVGFSLLRVLFKKQKPYMKNSYAVINKTSESVLIDIYIDNKINRTIKIDLEKMYAKEEIINGESHEYSVEDLTIVDESPVYRLSIPNTMNHIFHITLGGITDFQTNNCINVVEAPKK